tara:strand:- start:332 stop:526 length:195 start_codon:yes stop_codon:yes gene_type:complete
MTNLHKLAAVFNLEEYRDYKIENGSIYIIQHQENGGSFWLHFGKTLAYRNDKSAMFRDIASAIK